MADRPFRVPMVLRGKVYDDVEVDFGGRRGGVQFSGPDPRKHVDELTLGAPSRMADLYDLTVDDIVDYLVRLGERLPVSNNEYMQEAFRLSNYTSGLSESILRHAYEFMPVSLFSSEEIHNMIRRSVGTDYLDGWVPQPAGRFPGLEAKMRAFGARTVHVIAGNSPIVAYLTVLRNAFTRSDALIKAPSNDPLTAVSIARTMVDMDPDHPLTKHLAVAYWKGGDDDVESRIYDPRRIEKIVAWGGFDSVQHLTQYLQPGLDLITADPKLSGTIIGKEAFADEGTLQRVARRLALDMGAANQEGCVSARVVYVEAGTDDAGIERLNQLGELTFQALQQLPEHISTPHKAFDPELKEEIDAARFMEEDYKIYGGQSNEGAVIVSQVDEPVDFSRILGCRTSNLVPVDDVEDAIRSVNAYTQTVGVYPEALKQRVADRLAFQGAQRIVSLGGAATMQHNMEVQDAIEPVRRMVKWVMYESAPEAVLDSIGTAQDLRMVLPPPE
jgi:Acyl-CoA reductase (LuxC)